MDCECRFPDASCFPVEDIIQHLKDQRDTTVLSKERRTEEDEAVRTRWNEGGNMHSPVGQQCHQLLTTTIKRLV